MTLCIILITFLPKNNPNLKIIKGDIRDKEKFILAVKIMMFSFT